MKRRWLAIPIAISALLVPALSACEYDAGGQEPSYEGVDLDCEDVGREVIVSGSDPNGLDGDGDGVGCEGW